MSKELVISQFNGKVNIALLEDKRLIELHEDETKTNFSVGDIYIGKVKKLASNLNSTFVNIGYSKDAFLHYHDLGPQILSSLKYTKGVLNGSIKSPQLNNFQFEKEIHKNGKIDQVLQPGMDIMVQISKEPISTKGPRITSELSFAGRYLILTPFGHKISISKKIENPQEKERLKTLIESIHPEGFGVIVRTVAEGKKVEELHADLNFLLNKWNQAFKNLQKKKVPNLLMGELDRASSILRDYFNDDFVEIICDDEDLYKGMREYIQLIAPEKKNILKLYNHPTPLFEAYHIEKQIKQSFGKTISIPKSRGGYLIIEHTEALHVVDVNSGTINKHDNAMDSAALEVNLMAATELARQLRLRDMGGIIVIDFIDMPNSEHRKKLYEHFKTEMQSDRAKHKILPPSKFGLIQMTRQRVRPEKSLVTTEPTPNNNGIIESPIVILTRIEEQLAEAFFNDKSKIFLHVHTFIAGYLKNGIWSIQRQWMWKHKRSFQIIERDSLKFLEYKIINAKDEVLFSFDY